MATKTTLSKTPARKPAARKPQTLIGLAAELHRGVADGPAPWSGRLARAP